MQSNIFISQLVSESVQTEKKKNNMKGVPNYHLRMKKTKKNKKKYKKNSTHAKPYSINKKRLSLLPYELKTSEPFG